MRTMTNGTRGRPSGSRAWFLVMLILVVGCKDARETYQQAEAYMAAGKYDKALGAYENALRKANKEQLADLSGEIQEKIAQVRVRIREVASDEVKQHLRDAESHAAAQNWSRMLNSIERARRGLEKAQNPHLAGQVRIVSESPQVKLAQTAQVYARMSREARWSNWQHWLGGDDWFTFWSEVHTSRLGTELVRRAAYTGDPEVIDGAAELSDAWDKYWSAKVIARDNEDRSRSNSDDPGWIQVFDALVDVGVAVNEAYQGVQFDRKRREFETELHRTLGATRFPDLELDPPAPPTAPLASVPPTRGTGSGTGSGTVAPAPLTTRTRARTGDAGPTELIHGEDVIATE